MECDKCGRQTGFLLWCPTCDGPAGFLAGLVICVLALATLAVSVSVLG